MLTWPLAWHEAAEILIRLCPHWVMHPDPDGWGPLIHLCDGCCDLNYRQRPSLPVHQIQSD
jgi:hypothetical protein